MIKSNKITLLENILVDDKLPKFDKSKEFNDRESQIDGVNSSWFNTIPTNDIFGGVTENYNNTFYGRVKLLFHGKNKSDKLKPISIDDLIKFFNSIKENISELDNINITDILDKYLMTLLNAKENNQIALVERINDYIETLKYELILSMSKFNRFLTEQQIVDFYNVASVHEKYKTGLCLTYIKNFVKIIPNEITTLKKQADLLKVFDNYVILHYDYSGKSVADTKKEIEKKKDPILFGVIKNSNKLYYIGDWVDEYCDLTLDVIIQKLGISPSIIDADSIKNNIDKI